MPREKKTVQIKRNEYKETNNHKLTERWHEQITNYVNVYLICSDFIKFILKELPRTFYLPENMRMRMKQINQCHKLDRIQIRIALPQCK